MDFGEENVPILYIHLRDTALYVVGGYGGISREFSSCRYCSVGSENRYEHTSKTGCHLVLSSGCEVFAGVSIQYVILETGNAWVDKVFANKKVQRSDGMVVQQG